MSAAAGPDKPFETLMIRKIARRFFSPPVQVSPFTRPWDTAHHEEATEADIFYCFRLLLGRSPHIEEWKGHSSRIGEPLVDVVRTYVNSGEFNARGLAAVKIPEGVIEGHNGRFHVFADQEDRLLGAPALNGTYEPDVTEALEGLLAPGDHVLDVGANLGYFTLLAASLVGPTGQVTAVEPNESNVKLLESSRRRNGFENISVAQVAATNKIETLFLHATVGNGSVSGVRGDDSLFSVRTVPGVPLDVLMAKRTAPLKLIKIDVEGFEYRALQGARELLCEDRPYLAFEFSPMGIEGISGDAFLNWLETFGYSFKVLGEGGAKESNQTVKEVMAVFKASRSDHIDVLATPNETGIRIEDKI